MTQFTDLGLAEPILRAVSAEGYTTPTPIQAAVIPAMTSGRDVLGTAQTGTGKTAAFVLPLLHALAAKPAAPGAKRCRALILAPTRELAAQIAEAVRTYGRHLRPSVALVVGGVKPGPQIRAVAPGVDVVVATPGRLLDHVGAGALRLDAATTVVLDEADQMLDLGFLPAIRRIVAKLPGARQTVLLSATMPAPIRALAREIQTDPAEIAVASAESRPIELIDQSVVRVDRQAKRDVLVDLLRAADVTRAIVFTRTKRGADKVSRQLETAGLSAAALHGNKSQSQRERTLGAFRAGRVNVLVATDIAARGIDVDDVSHVVNYELPNVPEAYVHRIGRTARAGRSGVAVSLCDETERGLLRDIEKLIGRRLDGGGAPANDTRESAPAAAPQDERKPAGSGRRRRGGRGAKAGAKPAGKPGDKPHGPSRGKANGRGNGRGAGKPDAKPAPADRPARRAPSGAEATDAGLSRMLANIGG